LKNSISGGGDFFQVLIIFEEGFFRVILAEFY